jgi:pimeloyl-ACP methyl ester carboxylesterase
MDIVTVSGSFDAEPIPEWAPYREGVAHVNGIDLYYRDSGGRGHPLVLLHPATGSALIWAYQQAPFVAAGYRVITYSRRGHFGSAPCDALDGGCPSQDLSALVNFLAVDTFAILASAAGCAVALDFAIGHSERLSGLILSGGSFGNVDDTDRAQASADLRPSGFDEMPATFRELSPSYRAANVPGAKAWAALEQQAVTGNRMGTRSAHRITWETIGLVRAPTLFIAGGADLWSPPPLMRPVAEAILESKMIIMSDVGHSAYWEQPSHFNGIILRFLAEKNRRAGGATSGNA